jgi:membrane associated rhomboid family serine protease
MERMYGTREFTAFYLVAAIASGIGFVVWQMAIGYNARVIGASGAVLAVMTLFATHYPGLKIYVYGIFPIEIRWMIALYVLLDLWPVLQELRGGHPGSGVAHAAHLFGILFGWLYRRFHWHFSGWLRGFSLQRLPRRWRQTQAKRSLKVYDPEPQANLESEVDRILEKIHEHGSGSLTEREQHILSQASQQYKNRK